MASKPVTPDHPEFDENPEWTKADFARARPASEALPADPYRAFETEAHRQSLAVAESELEQEDQAFIAAISDLSPE